VLLPLMTAAIVPGWPRLLWGPLYEAVVAFPLFRSLFDLFLPKRLGFKVTPKGITSSTRSFDAASSKATLFAVAINLFAIAKGLTEALYFGIEKDAYFFNLAWAIYNVLFLLIAVAMAWERPQRRADERIPKRVRFSYRGSAGVYEGETVELSLSGLSFTKPPGYLAPQGTLTLHFAEPVGPQTIPAQLVRHERGASEVIAALAFRPTAEEKPALIEGIFCDPRTWDDAHRDRASSVLMMNLLFFWGFFRSLGPTKSRHRQEIREGVFMPARLVEDQQAARVWLRDRSARGLALWKWGDRPLPGDWIIFSRDRRGETARPVYIRRLLPFLWRVGLEFRTTARASEPIRNRVFFEEGK
jgi:cellulose synthase (UDP-forming)